MKKPQKIPGIHAVLIVDDDVHLADLLQKRLTDLGLDVSVVHTADEVDRVSLERTHDLYLMDIRVPGRNGVDLAGTLLTRNPESRVIFMTAYDHANLFRLHPELTGWAVLHKPFPMASVHEEIVKLLEFGPPERSEPAQA